MNRKKTATYKAFQQSRKTKQLAGLFLFAVFMFFALVVSVTLIGTWQEQDSNMWQQTVGPGNLITLLLICTTPILLIYFIVHFFIDIYITEDAIVVKPLLIWPTTIPWESVDDFRIWVHPMSSSGFRLIVSSKLPLICYLFGFAYGAGGRAIMINDSIENFNELESIFVNKRGRIS